MSNEKTEEITPTTEISKQSKRFVAPRAMAIAAALCGAVLYFGVAPAIGNYAVRIYPALSDMFWPTLIYLWLTAVPLALALWKLAHVVDGETYRDISVLCYIDAGMFAIGIVTLALLDLLHPGVLIVGMVALAWFIVWGRLAQKFAGRAL